MLFGRDTYFGGITSWEGYLFGRDNYFRGNISGRVLFPPLILALIILASISSCRAAAVCHTDTFLSSSHPSTPFAMARIWYPLPFVETFGNLKAGGGAEALGTAQNMSRWRCRNSAEGESPAPNSTYVVYSYSIPQDEGGNKICTR